MNFIVQIGAYHDFPPQDIPPSIVKHEPVTQRDASFDAKYKIKPSEITFLSANTWDVSGGGNYGYNAIWVNRNKNIFDNLDYSPKYKINDLKGLIEIIEQIANSKI